MRPIVSMQNKNFPGNQKELIKFLESTRKPKVIYTNNFWNLPKLVKISPGIIVRPHHTDQKQMGLLRKQCEE